RTGGQGWPDRDAVGAAVADSGLVLGEGVKGASRLVDQNAAEFGVAELHRGGGRALAGCALVVLLLRGTPATSGQREQGGGREHAVTRTHGKHSSVTEAVAGIPL